MVFPGFNSRKTAKPLLFGLFPLVILVGVCQLSAYSFRPGSVGRVPNQLPDSLANLGVSDGDDGQSLNLFVFYHPRCPCTQSTARNLAKISAFLRNDVNLTAFAYAPAEANESWLETSTTREFAGIPGCTIALDSDAKMSRLFEVHTSGHVLLYGHRGELLFSGGITPSRGHEGDCRSGNDLVRLINDGLASKDVPVEWPSFGCRIYSEEEIL